MLFKNFRLYSITHDLLLGTIAFLSFFLLNNSSHYTLLLLPGVCMVFLVVTHIRFLEKTNRDLIRFFDSVEHSDFSQTFSAEGRGKTFDELRRKLNEVMDRFRTARAEKEEHFRFLQTVVQHVGIALVAYKRDGEAVLVNTPALRLFNTAHLGNIGSLRSFSDLLVETMFTLKSGERKLIRVENDSAVLQLAVYAAEFVLHEEKITLVSIQDIKSELEEKEMEAWQNLIRVLTHEIMNSISPIISYASSIRDLVGQEYTDEDNRDELFRDIRNGIEAIHHRGQGLLHFVHNYRNLTNIPKPEFKIQPVRELLERVMRLMNNELTRKNIAHSITVEPESLEITADPKLIEQVLINLIVNAVQALENREESRIDIEAGLERRGKVFIKITDNGCGIVEEVLEKIFIPFFTTKREGSGIGLSLSRQIMRLHGGSIIALSKPNVFSSFILSF
jgi:nitrogen fixation/metabolism regulation signal transduction histidine kinase